jgi:hypothetical protein
VWRARAIQFSIFSSLPWVFDPFPPGGGRLGWGGGFSPPTSILPRKGGGSVSIRSPRHAGRGCGAVEALSPSACFPYKALPSQSRLAQDPQMRYCTRPQSSVPSLESVRMKGIDAGNDKEWGELGQVGFAKGGLGRGREEVREWLRT